MTVLPNLGEARTCRESGQSEGLDGQWLRPERYCKDGGRSTDPGNPLTVPTPPRSVRRRLAAGMVTNR
ncbi:MAG: hypothetical protein ACWGKN_02500 [Desulfoprunum sp.]